MHKKTVINSKQLKLLNLYNYFDDMTSTNDLNKYS